MNPEKEPENKVCLDLSLGLSAQEEDPVEDDAMQVPRPVSAQEKDPAEDDGTQLSGPVSDPPPNLEPYLFAHDMTLTGENSNDVTPSNVSGAALPPSPRLGLVSMDASSTYPPPEQLFHPHQATQHGARALETPRQGPKLGRPPAGHHARRNSSRTVAVKKKLGDKEIEPPYPWATTKPAVIHTFKYLSSKNINVISGQVHCRPCEKTQTLEFNLKEKYKELYQYIVENKEELRNRAPPMWMNSRLATCGSCAGQMRPVINENKEEINWLFLLLGQMLGCCTLEQLRYFCDKTSKHRTGAKDRVLYSTYLGLCYQLDPSGPFT